MYPFERFTERAKKVLTLAQAQAEASHHSYIGTEHLLLGLMREGDGVAATALRDLGVEIAAVRDTIENVLGRNERITIKQIIPTSRVKKVVELAFEEARRMGVNYVGTEHLLLGLLMEGEGIAAHVLEDLGAPLSKVRPEIQRLLAEGQGEAQAPGPPRTEPFRARTEVRIEQIEGLGDHGALAALAVLMHRFRVTPSPPAELLALIERARRDTTAQDELDEALEKWSETLRGQS